MNMNPNASVHPPAVYALNTVKAELIKYKFVYLQISLVFPLNYRIDAKLCVQINHGEYAFLNYLDI